MTKQWHWVDINGHNCFPFPCRKLLTFVSIIYMEEIILTSYLFKVDTPPPKNSIIVWCGEGKWNCSGSHWKVTVGMPVHLLK